ncbi:MAG: hypothetical protein K2P81_11420 [Bacteriovoracaceae bacterium]|nr:hypothetical protein [Bacteriovoracaceae bacterium]
MKKCLIAIVLASLVTGCATHSTMRGGVAMKVSDSEAHVCLGNGEVKEGDKVTAFYNDCQNITAGGGRNSGAYGAPCVKTKLGEGKITKVLNDHYSVVEFDEGVKFTEGTFVEKQ